MGRYNLTKETDLTRADVENIFELSRELKDKLKRGAPHRELEGRVLAMYFEKPSLRTRCTFDAGIYQLGGHGIYLEACGVRMGERESVYDVAKNLERWVDLVMVRTFSQALIEELARHCACPVINALSDEYHPCQALADLFTVRERRGRLAGLTLTFLGDGNNICASLALLCALLGVNFRHCGPHDYQLPAAIAAAARELAGGSGATSEYCADPRTGVAGSDLLYTDVWASMGQEDQAAARRAVFAPYQLNAALAARAKPDALIMHDLPAHRGEEITDEMLDCARSIVFDQAENRLHAQKGVMLHLMRKQAGATAAA